MNCHSIKQLGEGGPGPAWVSGTTFLGNSTQTTLVGYSLGKHMGEFSWDSFLDISLGKLSRWTLFGNSARASSWNESLGIALGKTSWKALLAKYIGERFTEHLVGKYLGNDLGKVSCGYILEHSGKHFGELCWGTLLEYYLIDEQLSQGNNNKINED